MDATRLPPIGKPLTNTRAYILDAHNQLLPVGVAGELCVAGPQVARGYLNLPELTQERFQQDPFHAGQRLYRTGDLARWMSDGNIEFLGRLDFQVKIRGYRIELGEIEALLQQQPSVEKALVQALPSPVGELQLVAYVSPSTAVAEPGVLVAALSAQLPPYMLPTQWVGIGQWPLTANGKVDRKALAEPQWHGGESGRELEGPVTATEHQLAALWQQVLGGPMVSRRDDFFTIGGHSLSAVILAAKMRNAFRIDELSTVHLFKNPTLMDLARVIDSLIDKPTSQLPQHLIPLQPNGTEIPLFIIPGVLGMSDGYHEMAQAFGESQLVFGLQMNGLFPSEEPFTDITSIVDWSIQRIRTIAPHGPYRLVGHSFGGRLVFEIAKKLLEEGHLVDFAYILDAAAEQVFGGKEIQSQKAYYMDRILARSTWKMPEQWVKQFVRSPANQLMTLAQKLEQAIPEARSQFNQEIRKGSCLISD